MDLFKDYNKQPDMMNFSGSFHYNQVLKQEGCFVEINFNKYFKNEDDTEELYNVIVRNFGVEQKNDLEERSIKFFKKYKIIKGDYVTYNNEVYLITSKVDEENKFYNKCKMTWCNHTIYLPDCPNQYAYLDDSSYGQKGVNSSPMMDFVDGQVKMLTQDNIYTKAIPDGYRLIFDFSPEEVYEVTQNTIITTKNVRRLSLKKVDSDYRDDFKNNIAYNSKKLLFGEDYENPRHEEIVEYKVKDSKNYYHGKYCPDGYDLKLSKRYSTKIYICDGEGNDLSDIIFNITSNIDKINEHEETIKVISQGNNYIEIENIYGYSNTDLIITFTKDDISIPIKIKLSR